MSAAENLPFPFALPIRKVAHAFEEGHRKKPGWGSSACSLVGHSLTTNMVGGCVLSPRTEGLANVNKIRNYNLSLFKLYIFLKGGVEKGGRGGMDGRVPTAHPI